MRAAAAGEEAAPAGVGDVGEGLQVDVLPAVVLPQRPRAGRHQLVAAPRRGHAHELQGAHEAVHVRVEAEDEQLLALGVVVAAHPLEDALHARPAERGHRHQGLRLRHDLAVPPDQLCHGFHRHSPLLSTCQTVKGRRPLAGVPQQARAHAHLVGIASGCQVAWLARSGDRRGGTRKVPAPERRCPRGCRSRTSARGDRGARKRRRIRAGQAW